MEGEEGNLPAEKPVEESQPKNETPTQENLEQLLAKAREEGKAEAEKVYKGIQKTLAKKDQEIKKLKETKPSDYDAVLENLAGILKNTNGGFGDSDAQIEALERQIKEIKQSKEVEKISKAREEIISASMSELEAKLPEGVDEDVIAEINLSVKDAMRNSESEEDYKRRINLIHKRIDKMYAQEKPKEEVKPAESQLTEEQEAEIARKWLEKQGKLKINNPAIPSGSGRQLTPTDVKDYSPQEILANSAEIAKISLG